MVFFPNARGIRKTVALETRENDDAVRKALDLANGRNLAIGGTLEGEIEAFIAFKLESQLRRFARWIGGGNADPID